MDVYFSLGQLHNISLILEYFNVAYRCCPTPPRKTTMKTEKKSKKEVLPETTAHTHPHTVAASI
jgi:hypothetical protein